MAAVVATFALWVVAVVWVTIALAAVGVGGRNQVLRAVEVSLVAFGLPFFVLTVVLPLAVYADASAIQDADGEWRPRRLLLSGAAAVGALVSAGAVFVALVTGSALAGPLWAVVLGFLLAVPVAAFYLLRRHRRLGAP